MNSIKTYKNISAITKFNNIQKYTYYYFVINFFNKLPSRIKILSQNVKQFKSAYKNYHNLNSLYTSYEHCDNNTATHHSHNVQTGSADQTFYCSKGTLV
jgi:hypothetical protein